LSKLVFCGGFTHRKSSGNLISCAPARLNLFNKIHAKKPYLPANLDSFDSQPSLRDSIPMYGLKPYPSFAKAILRTDTLAAEMK
jgi:hypothetical protein